VNCEFTRRTVGDRSAQSQIQLIVQDTPAQIARVLLARSWNP